MPACQAIVGTSINLHIHEQVHALVEVGLLQGNADGDSLFSRERATLDHAVGATLLVEDRVHGHAEGGSDEGTEEDGSDLHDDGLCVM